MTTRTMAARRRSTRRCAFACGGQLSRGTADAYADRVADVEIAVTAVG